MGIFDFVVNNVENLAQINVDENGAVLIDLSEFDFSHPDLAFEFRDDDLVFSVIVDRFSLTTRVSRLEMKTASIHLQSIRDAEIRKDIVEILEGGYRPDSEEDVKTAEEDLRDATSNYADADKAHAELLAAMREIKDAWGIL